MSEKLSALVLTLVLTVSLPVTGTAQGSGAGAPDTTWLRWNATTRTATFKLIAGVPGRAKSPFNFNGYTDGELTLTVPENSTVVVNFVNDDGTPHSAEVIADTPPIRPGSPGTPPPGRRPSS